MTDLKVRLAAILVAASVLMFGGWKVSTAISTAPTIGAVTLPAQTIVHTSMRVLTKVVKGRVVTLKGGQRVIRVPIVVIHNLRCHPTRKNHCVRSVVVPAHTIPLKAATIHQLVAIAAPLMPITVYATVTSPPVTITLPAQTVTSVQTDTTTETDLVTVTITVPATP